MFKYDCIDPGLICHFAGGCAHVPARDNQLHPGPVHAQPLFRELQKFIVPIQDRVLQNIGD